jgi:hypothetical protein
MISSTLSEMNLGYMHIRMVSLKNACDKKNMHKAILIIERTVYELMSLPLVGINEKVASRVTMYLKLALFYITRFMFGEAKNNVQKIMTEIHMFDLIIKMRLEKGLCGSVGSLGALPNDVMEAIGGMIGV